MREAAILLHAYMKYDEKQMTEQQALDKLEEVLHELDEKHSIAIDVNERFSQKA